MNKRSFVSIIAALMLASPPVFAAGAPQPTPQPAPAAETSVSAKNQEDLEKQLEQARAQLETAAHRVAELSMQLNGPAIYHTMHMRMPAFADHAVLGITVDERGSGDPKTGGVVISAVSPGGPADKAGLHAGDVITSINGKVFKSTGDDDASEMLVDFMDGVKPGDALKVNYSRDGKANTAAVTAGRLWDYRFAFGGPVPPQPPVPPVPPMPPRFGVWFGADRPWSQTQLVPLTPALGQYFGTDKGLLVVRAPQSSDLQLQDGDVILKIGGRDPGDPTHAMRILGSYNPGESVKIDIMRKGKPATLDVTLPKSRGDRGADWSDDEDDDTP